MRYPGSKTSRLIAAVVVSLVVVGSVLAVTTGAFPVLSDSTEAPSVDNPEVNGSIEMVVEGKDATATGKVQIDGVSPVIESPTLTDRTDGDGVVGDGDRIQIAAIVRDSHSSVDHVEANGSAFGAGIVELTDDTGDGTYTVSITVDGSQAKVDGSYAIIVGANDTADNTATAYTTELEIARKPVPTSTPADTISPGLPGFGPVIAIAALLIVVAGYRWRE